MVFLDREMTCSRRILWTWVVYDMIPTGCDSSSLYLLITTPNRRNLHVLASLVFC